MSGLEVAGLILGIYPLVGGAVSVYKATKTSKPAAALIRRLKTEEVIYRQFVRNLIAPDISEEGIHMLMGQETWDPNRRRMLCSN